MARGSDETPQPAAKRNPLAREIQKEGQGGRARPRVVKKEPEEREVIELSFLDRVQYFAQESYPSSSDHDGYYRQTLEALEQLDALGPDVLAENSMYHPEHLHEDTLYLRGFFFALWNETNPPEPRLAHLQLAPEDNVYLYDAYRRIMRNVIVSSLAMEKGGEISESIADIDSELERSFYGRTP